MAISRAQLLKELLPGLNALFGLEYARYGEEHQEIYETETSERSFEEETKLSGFSAAPVKNEGSAIAYDNAQEAWTARYNHETIALGFSLAEEAIEDNLYDSLSARYTKGLARAMAYTKQVKAAAVLNNGFSAGYVGGDGVSLFNTSHPLVNGGVNSNTPSTQASSPPYPHQLSPVSSPLCPYQCLPLSARLQHLSHSHAHSPHPHFHTTPPGCQPCRASASLCRQPDYLKDSRQYGRFPGSQSCRSSISIYISVLPALGRRYGHRR